MMLYGKKLIHDSSMVKLDDGTVVDRSWKERLFTLPFKPFKKTKVVYSWIPSEELLVSETSIIGHPTVIDALVETIKNQ